MISLALLTMSLTVQTPAVAISVSGTVEVDSGSGPTVIRRFAKIPEGASVTTHATGATQIRLASGSILRLGPSTTINLKTLSHGNPAGKRRESLKLVVGKLWARVTSLFGSESRFEVETKTAVAGVRGTSFVAEADGDNDRFVLIHGLLDLSRGDGKKTTLNRPGSFATSTGAGFGAAGLLTGAQLNSLRRAVGGAGGTLTSRLPYYRPGRGSGEAALRRGLRGDINGPGRLVDSPLGVDPSSPRLGAAATSGLVDVVIDLRDPQPGGQ